MAYRVNPGEQLSASAVAESEVAPAPPPADDLDWLLADFDRDMAQIDNNAHQSPEPGTSSPELAAAAADYAPHTNQHATPNQQLVERINEIERQHVIEKAGKDLKATVAEVRGELDSSIYNDDFVQTWVDNQARQNMALQSVWLNRDSDPQAFRGAVAGLSRQFHKTFRMAPDHDATEDRHAVVAAMRGASSRVPADPPLKFGRLSNAEYAREVREKFGFDPGV